VSMRQRQEVQKMLWTAGTRPKRSPLSMPKYFS
jgi:hypothetical protein